MGIARGPNIITEDLVFGYDSGYGVADNDTSTRFYAGEPKTNYLSSGVSGHNVVQGSNWNGATPTYTLGTSEFGTPIGTYTVGSTSYMYSTDQVLDDDLSTLSGQAITFSVYLKRQSSNVTSTIGIRVYDNISGYTTVYAAATSEFQRFTLTKTLGVNPTRIFVMIDNTNGGVIDFHSPQLEIGDASPFVDGTRSATASLIDLKRTRDISVANISFEGTGQPDFDGTDDFISITDLLASQSIGSNTQLTISLWLNQDAYGSKMAFSTGQSGADRIYYWTQNSLNTWRVGDYTSTTGHDTLPSVGEWYNTVLVISGNNVTVYLNGVEDYTGTYTGFTTEHYATFGRHGATTSYYYNGNIAVAKIYEKALSAAEIKQNFNAYKNRFNI